MTEKTPTTLDKCLKWFHDNNGDVTTTQCFEKAIKINSTHLKEEIEKMKRTEERRKRYDRTKSYMRFGHIIALEEVIALIDSKLNSPLTTDEALAQGLEKPSGYSGESVMGSERLKTGESSNGEKEMGK
jgi:hypothetical protein